MSARLDTVGGAPPKPNESEICRAALTWAEKGVEVFPIIYGKKKPATTHGFLDATRDPDKIRDMFPPGRKRNLGIRTGDRSGNVVIDEDGYKEGAKDTLKALEVELGPLPETLTVQTRAGGRHLIFEYPEGRDLRSPAGEDGLGLGIDVRGNGGYIVGPGSWVDEDDKGPAGDYKIIIDAPIAKLPTAWVDRVEALSRGQKPSKANGTKLSSGLAAFGANVSTGFVLPEVIREGGRNDTLFRYLGSLLGKGYAWNDAVQAVRDANAARCQPPLDDEELALILRRKEDQADKTTPQGDDSEADQAVAELNRTHFIAPEGGKVRVYIQDIDPETGTPTITPYSREDFKLLIANRRVRVGTGMVPLADHWLKSHSARRYRGIAMLPGPLAKTAPPDIFNTWSGWGVEPKPGDHETALGYIFKVICSEDPASFKYLVGWMAHAVQHPDKPAEVALVLRSVERGTGKGTFANMLVAIFGGHGLAVRNSKHLVGNFNAHLRNILLLFADEAFFVGDRSGNEVLKGLITEPTLPIERKGVDVFSVQNRLKIVMATNSEWVVPAGADERRFMVLDVSPVVKQNHTFFRKFKAYLEREGLSALLHHLLEYDLSNFNIRSVPSTKGLIDQKNRSLDPFHQWLRERLWDGFVSPTEAGWVPTQDRNVIVNGFRDYVERKHLRYAETDASYIGRRLQKLFPGIERSKRARIHGCRIRTWKFPELAEARRAFEIHALGGDSLDWPTGEDDA